MDQKRAQRVTVGNDFVVRTPRLAVAANAAMPSPQPAIPLSLPETLPDLPEEAPVLEPALKDTKPTVHLKNGLDLLHANSLIVFCLMFLAIGGVGSQVVSRYFSIRMDDSVRKVLDNQKPLNAASNINMAVPAAQLAATLQKITSQPASLNLGSQTVSIPASTIKNWLEVTPSANGQEDNLHTNPTVIQSSLTALIDQYVVAPVNQVSVTHNDGITPSGVIVAGQDGTALSDSAKANLPGESQQIANGVMNSKGFQVNAPLTSVPYQSVTPSAFSKLIEVDLTTKRLYAYANGQVVNTFLVSAGKPSTPTPVGEFHIWDKLTVQTMTGPGYVQPNVPWINYFDHSGDAIHGVYWRPDSVFGNVNTSHGCVGLQLSPAEWVYNWAPIGTTVITYT